MARSERLSVMVEPETARQLKVLADGTGMTVSTFVNVLLTQAIGMVGSTFATMGQTMEGLQAADKEHDES
jgi:hypothetical protein